MNIKRLATHAATWCTLLLLLASCGKTNSTTNVPSEPKKEWKPSDLSLAENKVSVKVGESSIQALEILKGAGGYNAFPLDTSVVKASIKENQLLLEGLKLGRTDVILSDKSEKYIKVPVSVYLTDDIKLSSHELKIPGLPGAKKRLELDILEGNGVYSCESDNELVIAGVDRTDKKIILAISFKDEDYTATITVKDQSEKMTTLKIEATVTDDPFTDDVVAEILTKEPRTYTYDGQGVQLYGKSNKHTRNQFTYGANQWGYIYLLSIPGPLETGAKMKGDFELAQRSGQSIKTKVDVKVLKADGETAYIAFKYKNEKGEIHYGYIVDEDLNAQPESLEIKKSSLAFTPTKDEPETLTEEVEILSGKGPFKITASQDGIEGKIVNDQLQVTATTKTNSYYGNLLITDANNQSVIINVKVEGFLKPLMLSKEYFNLQGQTVGETLKESVEILSGGGGYEVESDHQDVSATLNGKTISITALSGAKEYTARITVRDKYEQSETITVNVQKAEEILRTELKVSETKVTISGERGKQAQEEVTILSGAGGYTPVSSDPILTARVSGNKIILSATPDESNHTVFVTLKDAKGQELVITVTVQRGSSSGDKYADFLADDTKRYFYEGEQPLNLAGANSQKFGSRFGFKQYGGSRHEIVLFNLSDKEPGVKEGVKITVKNVWGKNSMMAQYPVRSCEVLKNDGTKIWIKVVYGTRDNQLVTLFICDTLNG